MTALWRSDTDGFYAPEQQDAPIPNTSCGPQAHCVIIRYAVSVAYYCDLSQGVNRMNLIKKVGLPLGLALCIAASSAPAFAQGFRGRGPGISVVEIPIPVLAPALKLSDAQKDQIGAIDTQYQADVRALRPAPGAPRDPQTFRQMFQKTRDLTQTDSQKIEALLSDQQKTDLKLLLKDLQAITMTGIPVAALPAVQLTGDQRAKIIKIGEEAQAAIQQKIQDAGGDFSQIRAALGPIRQDAKAKADALLTADQLAILQKYPQGGGFGGGRRRPPAAAAPAQ